MLINSPNISGSLTVTGNTVIAGGLTAGTVTSGAVTATGLFVETGSSFGGALNLRQATGFSLWSGAPYTSIYATTGNRVIFNFSNDNRTFTLDGSLVSSASPRTFTFPDATGTFALTNQIGSFSVSGSTTLVGNTVVTGSFTVTTGSNVELQVTNTGVTLGNISTDIHNVTGSFNVSGSTRLNGNTAVTGSLTVTGQVVAQTLNVQQVTSSIVYSSGSNIFGNSLANTQQFTGSVGVTGSFTVTTSGTEFQVTNTGVTLGNTLTDSHIISGSFRVNPNGLFVSGSGIVGIGTTTPTNPLHIQSNTLSQLNVTALSGNTNAQINLEPTGTGIALIGPANNVDLAFRTNATTRMLISGSGNVGIGTPTPGERLTIQSSASGTAPQLKLQNPVDSNSSQGAANNLSAGQLLFGATGAFPLTARIESIYGPDASFGRQADLVFSGANGSGTLSERMRITSGGNVGIGTDNPQSSLHIYSTNATAIIQNSSTSSVGNLSRLFYRALLGSGAIGFVGFIDGVLDSTTQNTGYLKFHTYNNGNADERMRITSGGNVLMGTTTDNGARLQVSNGTLGLNLQAHVVNITGNNYSSATVGIYDAASLAANTGGGINFGAFYTSTQFTEFAYIRTNKDTATSGEYGGSLIFATRPNGGSPTERMRITSDNNVLFNTTSTSTSNTSSFIFRSGTGAYSGVMIMNHATTNNTGAGFIDCYYNTSYIGGVAQNGASNVSFLTSSDYRLKEDLKNFNGLNLISNLKVYDFKWKTENSRMYGLIAHELQEVIPYTVSGNKDEMKENGKIKVQVVDYSKLVPVLVKAIQELKSENDSLKSRIEILENK